MINVKRLSRLTRTALDINQTQLAEMLKTTQATISRIESGRVSGAKYALPLLLILAEHKVRNEQQLGGGEI